MAKSKNKGNAQSSNAKGGASGMGVEFDSKQNMQNKKSGSVSNKAGQSTDCK